GPTGEERGETFLREARQGPLHRPVFERVEGDDRDPRAGLEPRWPSRRRLGRAAFDRRQECFEAAQLVVDGDAEGLEGSGGGVDGAGRGSPADCRTDDVRELSGGLYRRELARGDKF